MICQKRKHGTTTLSLLKFFFYDVYVPFRTHIVKIEDELALFSLNFGEMVLCTITTLISKGSTDWDVLVLDLSTMTTLIFKYIYLKFVFSEKVCLQCLHPFLHTYSQNMSSVKFSHTWCCYNDYINFRRFTSLRCFGPWFGYNVCVVFDTHIVETQAGST